ncbi:MAG: YraN family protein [Planctomycetes bacterium]|nr:YraN family protein [Planctomycetota bacterium]
MWPFGRNLSTGRRGERLAAKALKRAGCAILARNYRCAAGEADLVALAGDDTLVFAEVKTRSTDRYADPELAVNKAKRERYHKVARSYLRTIGRSDLAVRFDIVAVVLPRGARPVIRHIPDAFR